MKNTTTAKRKQKAYALSPATIRKYYDAMMAYPRDHQDLLGDKIRSFLDLLHEFREKKKETPLPVLLWDIYRKTGFYYDVQLMKDGENRKQNLLMLLKKARDYEQIILSRPTVVLGNQEIGFLPGDEKTKMSPFLQPLMDNLGVIKSQFRPSSKEALRLDGFLKDEKLLITPLAYIRGRSLGKAFFIIDEAQNLTPHEIKTIITRAGEGTKMVFTGDIFQIDQPYLDQWSNGLTHLGEKMAGQPLFQHVFLRKGERSQLSEIAAKLL